MCLLDSVLVVRCAASHTHADGFDRTAVAQPKTRSPHCSHSQLNDGVDGIGTSSTRGQVEHFAQLKIRHV